VPSAPIRDLIDYDQTIEIASCDVGKSYADVTFKVADVRSSKESFRQGREHLGNYLREVGRILDNEIPADDQVLVICLKEVEDDVKRAMSDMNTNRQGKIHVLHWGEHRAVNHYGDCRWLITVGVMYLPPSAVASMIIGQTRNLHYGLSDSEVRTVLLSEQAEMIYQGVSRGHSRKTVDGRAGAQTIYLFHPAKDWDRIYPLLRELMPGMRVERYYPAFLIRESKKAAFEVARNIVDFLAELPLNVVAASTRGILKTHRLNGNDRVWREGLEIALDQLRGWRKEGQMFIRIQPD
jgi:hypothetical protein